MTLRLGIVGVLLVQGLVTVRLGVTAGPPPHQNGVPPSNSTRVPEERSKTFSSMLSVDPTQILTTLMDKGGLLIPSDSEIRLLRDFFHVERAELNVVEKHLILHNFAIGIANKPYALRVGRVYVHWNSYTQPCLEIEVDGVDIRVDFTNLVLTRNNWNELVEAGFPPQSWLTSSSDDPLPFVRFGSLDLSGLVTIRLTSRPLAKDLGELALDMYSTKDLTEWIRHASDRNEASGKRRGCNSSELVAILRSYFGKKVRGFLEDGVLDIAKDPGAAARNADLLWHQASDSILQYAEHAGRKTGATIQDKIVSKFDSAASTDKFAALKDRAIKIIERSDSEALHALFNDMLRRGEVYRESRDDHDNGESSFQGP